MIMDKAGIPAQSKARDRRNDEAIVQYIREQNKKQEEGRRDFMNALQGLRSPMRARRGVLQRAKDMVLGIGK